MKSSSLTRSDPSDLGHYNQFFYITSHDYILHCRLASHELMQELNSVFHPRVALLPTGDENPAQKRVEGSSVVDPIPYQADLEFS